MLSEQRVLCLITDRHRLARATERPLSEAIDLVVAQVEGAVRGGIDVVQVRERDLDATPMTDLVRRCLRVAAGTNAAIVVNDRLDIALATGAHGVHLPERGLPLQEVQEQRRDLLVGRSIHTVGAAASSRSADYLIAGSVFETASKPGASTGLGVQGLRLVVDAAGECPVWAIGGITRDRLGRVLESGARGAAAIGAYIPHGATGDLVTAVQNLVAEMRLIFD